MMPKDNTIIEEEELETTIEVINDAIEQRVRREKYTREDYSPKNMFPYLLESTDLGSRV